MALAIEPKQGATPDGVVLVGAFTGQVDFGAGPWDSAAGVTAGFLAKLDGAGQIAVGATKLFKSDISTTELDVAVNAQGVVYAAGRFYNAMDLDGHTLDAPGELTNLMSAFIVSYDADGGYRWSSAMGHVGNHVYPQALAVDIDGGALFVGVFRAPNVEFSDGSVVGSNASSGEKYDAFLAKFEANPADPFPGPSSEAFAFQYPKDASGVVPAPVRLAVAVSETTGNIAMAGSFTGSVDMGAGPMVANSGTYRPFVTSLGRPCD